MNKKFIFPLIAIFLVTCQKDADIQNPLSNSSEVNQIEQLQTAEQVFAFLSEEMPETYTETEIKRVKSMLDDAHDKQFYPRGNGNTVELLDGSVDGLQAAVDEAGPGGTVIVKAGTHTVNGLVTVPHRIKIRGENGAIIRLPNPLITEPPFQFMGGIHVIGGADRSIISNIHFDGGNGAGAGIYINGSDRVTISQNSFSNFQFSILVNSGNNVSIKNNELIQGIPELLQGSRGIVIVNGRSASIVGNIVSGSLFGIWCCDKGGLSWGNTTTGNFYGQIVCKVPPAILGQDGEIFGSQAPGNHWLVAMNESSNNLYGGIVVIDGAFKNVLLANKGSGNAAYDVDLVGDSERFGFLTPTSVKNKVWSFSDQTVKDCGEDNTVIGGIEVDTEIDPCM